MDPKQRNREKKVEINNLIFFFLQKKKDRFKKRKNYLFGERENFV